ncbi:MAG: hypothetical protein U1A78_37265 [Polyangia bacterium]
MPLDADSLLAAERIRAPGAGTEYVAFFLYSAVRMLRCRNVLEVGMGYLKRKGRPEADAS